MKPLYFAFVVVLAAATLTACASIAPGSQHARGSVDSIETVKAFSRQSIDAANSDIALSGPARCGVKVVQLVYRSIGVRKEPATVSAALYVPEDCAGPFPLLAEAHGTESDRRRLMTDVQPGAATLTFFAARGYLVVATDYLGLGKSDYPYHPYLHADSEASAVIDSLRAARTAAGRLGVAMDDKVLLFGYSQGGHAALAAQREMERHHRKEFHLVASAPMAGPYNLSQTFLASWFGSTAGQENMFASALLTYAIVSYNRIYGTLYAQPDELFAARYAGNVERLFSGSFDISEMYERQLLPPGGHLNELRTPAFTASFLTDDRQPLREALRKNDLLDWTPTTPTLLCGSRRDAIVDFQSTYAAQASFGARGAEVAIADIADDIPAAASGTEHHTRYAALCYEKARTQLFEPLLQHADLAGR